MTDKEIIHDLECCIGHDCEMCSRKGREECGEELDKDILSVLRLQQNALEAGSQAITKLKADNIELSLAVRYSFTKSQLVDAVNRIIESLVTEPDCYECGGDYWGGKISAVQDFIKLIDSKNCAVVIKANGEYPLIQCLEK